jgi:hypothetical protein
MCVVSSVDEVNFFESPPVILRVMGEFGVLVHAAVNNQSEDCEEN